jgi:hypothetical protein
MGRAFLGISVGSALVVLVTCSPFEADQTPDAETADAETPDAGAGTAEAGTPDPRSDGSAALCQNGILTGARVTDISPPDAGAVVCNVGNALVRDEAVAGLDRSSYENWWTIDGNDVNGCLAVEFDRAVSVAYLRLENVGNACGYACAGSSCGLAQSAGVFAGPSLRELHFIDTPALPRSLTDLTVSVPPSSQVIAICRPAYSKDGDDVAVDAVTADCIATDN